MEEIIKHYGPVVLSVVAFLALGSIVVNILSANGVVDVAFREIITSFLTDMKAVGTTPPASTVTPTGTILGILN